MRISRDDLKCSGCPTDHAGISSNLEELARDTSPQTSVIPFSQWQTLNCKHKRLNQLILIVNKADAYLGWWLCREVQEERAYSHLGTCTSLCVIHRILCDPPIETWCCPLGRQHLGWSAVRQETHTHMSIIAAASPTVKGCPP